MTPAGTYDVTETRGRLHDDLLGGLHRHDRDRPDQDLHGHQQRQGGEADRHQARDQRQRRDGRAPATSRIDSGGDQRPRNDVPGRRVARHDVTLDAAPTPSPRRARPATTASYSADCTGNDRHRPDQDLHGHQQRPGGEADRDQARDQRQRRDGDAADFTLDGGRRERHPPTTSPGAESPGHRPSTLDAGTYNVTETGPSRLHRELLGRLLGHRSPSAQTKTCTVTNNDIAPKLIVIKHVINDNGGTAAAADFTMTVDGHEHDTPASFAGAESPGTTVTLDAGTYNVTETGPSATRRATRPTAPGTIADRPDQDLHRHQRRHRGEADVIKHVINDNGGTATAARLHARRRRHRTTPRRLRRARSRPAPTVTLDAGRLQRHRDRPVRLRRELLGRLHGHRSPSARPRPARSPTTTTPRS